MRFLPCFVAALVSTGCVSTETTPWAYRLPLARNMIGPDAVDDCAVTCHVDNSGNEAAFFACLERCPGISVEEGAECTDSRADQPPIARCYTRLVAHDVFDPSAVEALFDLVGAVGQAASAASAGSGHHSSFHHTNVAERDRPRHGKH